MKIGEFAKVCSTRISVLRHYDKQNLLRPVYIDKFTGYRYYSQEQISKFFRITALKEAGFSLIEIRELLAQLQSDSDVLALFEKKRTVLLETLNNLNKAKELIIGGQSIMNVTIYEDAGCLWAKYIYAKGSNINEACEKMDNTITAQNYQRISSIQTCKKETALICRVVKLNDEISALMECTDLPFEDDEEVIGKWETVGEYAVKEDFFEAKPCKQNWYYEYPQIIYFLPKGESYWCYHWTKGKLLIETGDTSAVNEYEVEEYNGERFMFVSFKSYDYRKGGVPTDYYVFIRE